MKKIDRNSFKEIITSLIENNYKVYAPIKKNDIELSLDLISEKNIDKIEIGLYRSFNPLKNFFLKPKEIVTVDEIKAEKTVIIGAKNCDLLALSLLDKVFLGKKFVDPFYKARRENTTIIGVDCSDCLPVCFCAAVGVNPYPEKNADVCLSHYSNSEYLINYVNEKGSSLFSEFSNFFSEVDDEGNTQKVRAEVKEKVIKQNSEYKDLKTNVDNIRDFYEKEVWQECGENCVGCSACTFICPTCHCYILEEHSTPEEFKKVRQWDSCILGGYARVAGGETPRPEIKDRLKNRYMCKFDFLERYFEIKGCVGCGRCIAAELGKIDMRKFLSNLNKTGEKI